MDEFEDYYANLLSSCYRGKPNASAEIRAYAREVKPLVQAFIDFRETIDINLARGENLDRIGRWVGQSRSFISTIDRQTLHDSGKGDAPAPTSVLGAAPLYDQAENSPTPFTVSTLLTDAQYRTLLKAKIISMFSDNSVFSTQSLVNALYNSQITERVPGTITVFLRQEVTDEWLAITRPLLQAPMGVVWDVVRSNTGYFTLGSTPLVDDREPFDYPDHALYNDG